MRPAPRLNHRTVISSLHAFLVEDARPVLPVLKALFGLIGKGEEEAQQNRPQRPSRFEQRQSSPPVPFLRSSHA